MQRSKGPRQPTLHPLCHRTKTRPASLISCLAKASQPHHVLPSGEEMVEERGVPVHEDWSMAPDDDRVRFSLSGVAPHSWKESPRGRINGGCSAGVDPPPLGILMDGGRAKKGQTPARSSGPKPPSSVLPPQLPTGMFQAAHLLAPTRGSPGDPQLRLSAGLLVLLFGQNGGVL